MARPRPPRTTPAPADPNDAPDDAPVHPAEERRLRRELQSRVDHLFEIARRKGFGSARDEPEA